MHMLITFSRAIELFKEKCLKLNFHRNLTNSPTKSLLPVSGDKCTLVFPARNVYINNEGGEMFAGSSI